MRTNVRSLLIGDRKSLSIAKNHPKTSQDFSEQFGPSTHKIKGFGKNSHQKVHPNFAEILGRQIPGNTLSGPKLSQTLTGYHLIIPKDRADSHVTREPLCIRSGKTDPVQFKSIMCKWTRPFWGTDCRRAPKSLSSAQATLLCSSKHWESSKVLAGLAFCEMRSQYPWSAFRGCARVTRGGQQQFATQTLRVHLLGVD